MDAGEIVDLLNKIGIDSVRLNSRGTEISSLCPFHEESRPSFGVSTEKMLFNCFGCGAKGSLLLLVCRLKKLTPSDGRIFIEKFGPYDIEESFSRTLFKEVDIEQTKEALVSSSMYAPYTTLKRLLRAKEYLSKRGIVYRKSGTLTKTWHTIGYDPKQHRCLFPWYGLGNQFYGCIGRVDYKPETDLIRRYMPYFGIQRSHHIFFGHAHWQKLKSIKSYVIVEGEIDAIRVSQLYPLTGMVAFALGNAYASRAQCSFLKRIGGPFVEALDTDAAGRTGGEKLRGYLKAFVPIDGVLWPEKDAGACSNVQIVKTLNKMPQLRF